MPVPEHSARCTPCVPTCREHAGCWCPDLPYPCAFARAAQTLAWWWERCCAALVRQVPHFHDEDCAQVDQMHVNATTASFIGHSAAHEATARTMSRCARQAKCCLLYALSPVHAAASAAPPPPALFQPQSECSAAPSVEACKTFRGLITSRGRMQTQRLSRVAIKSGLGTSRGSPTLVRVVKGET